MMCIIVNKDCALSSVYEFELFLKYYVHKLTVLYIF